MSPSLSQAEPRQLLLDGRSWNVRIRLIWSPPQRMHARAYLSLFAVCSPLRGKSLCYSSKCCCLHACAAVLRALHVCGVQLCRTSHTAAAWRSVCAWQWTAATSAVPAAAAANPASGASAYTSFPHTRAAASCTHSVHASLMIVTSLPVGLVSDLLWFGDHCQVGRVHPRQGAVSQIGGCKASL